MPAAETSTSFSEYARLFARYLIPLWRKVLLLAILLFGNLALLLTIPQILRFFIDSATGSGSLNALLLAAVFFLGVALAQQILSVLATYFSEDVGWSSTNALRVDLARHCLQLDMGFHHERTPGEMIERVDGDVEALGRFFSQFVIQIHSHPTGCGETPFRAGLKKGGRRRIPTKESAADQTLQQHLASAL